MFMGMALWILSERQVITGSPKPLTPRASGQGVKGPHLACPHGTLLLQLLTKDVKQRLGCQEEGAAEAVDTLLQEI